jgi:hypothetical protein
MDLVRRRVGRCQSMLFEPHSYHRGLDYLLNGSDIGGASVRPTHLELEADTVVNECIGDLAPNDESAPNLRSQLSRSSNLSLS